jgi:hypothetical protein
MTKFLTDDRRRWIYGVAIAAFAVLVYYGVIDREASPLILALVLAALNVPGGPVPDGIRALSINNMRRKKHDDKGAFPIGRALAVVALVAVVVLVAPEVASANSINNMR